MKNLFRAILALTFFAFFAQNINAQNKFLQKLLLASGDSVAINFSEVRFVTTNGTGTTRIGYGKPISIYYATSSFASIVSASCGNLVTFIEHRSGGGTDTIALNPKYIKSASMVSGDTKTRLFVDGHPDRRIVGGAFFHVTGLLSACPSGSAVGDALVGNPLSQFAATTSAQLAGIMSNETGTGLLVFGTSPVLTTPNIGTPSAGVLTNATGLPIATGVSGLGTGVATFLATPSSANLISAVTNETGTGALVFATSPTLVTPLLGTPTSGVMTNVTGLPLTTGVTGTLPVANGGTGRATSTTAYGLLAAGTTATGAHQTLAAGATTEILVGGGASALPVWTTATGSGAPVRATSPTLVTPALGTPSALVLTNATGLPTAGLSGYITATAALDFASTTAQMSADLTITLTGAAVGDAVMLGAANASVLGDSEFTAWVSATNTVTVRFNNYSSGALDPASGTFRVSILK